MVNYYNVFLITRLFFLMHFIQIVKNFIKKSPTRRKGEQFTIVMLKSAVPYC
ncbi:hypothetical protein HMPREF9554_03039 [Treponema phagedenis F0421]|nr:hypothetical protein HMPREF9554_03039 [Treponema phagedenis F0421]